MQGSDQRKGVFGADFAEDRGKKPHLKFRLKTRARIVAEAARRYLDTTTGLAVMDMGAAEGRTLAQTSSLMPGSTFTGVEYSQELVDSAVDLPGNVRLIRGDITRLPDQFRANSFDVVSALAVLENLESPADAVREAARVLKPGGLFVATVPEPTWCRVCRKLGIRKVVCDVTDVGKGLVVETLEDAGLDLVEFRRFMWAPIAALAYLHLPTSPSFCLACDRGISSLRIFDWLFVNQSVVGRKGRASG